MVTTHLLAFGFFGTGASTLTASTGAYAPGVPPLNFRAGFAILAEPEPEPEEETPAVGGGGEPSRRAPFTGRGFFDDDEPRQAPPGEQPAETKPQRQADAPLDSLLPRDQSGAQARLDAAREKARRAEAEAIRRADDARLIAYLEAESARIAQAVAEAIDNDDAEILLLDHAIRMDAVGMVLKRILKK